MLVNKMDNFSGSYAAGDVRFLLKPMLMEDTPVHLKEQLIQSGQKHYSELLTLEALPKAAYIQLFHQALALNQARLARHLLVLAEGIVSQRPQGVTLVSLLRAGTPFGVLLKHILKRYHKLEATHYSISILRDIGLDACALHYILQNHAPETLVFVDGWTGKGVIAGQLRTSLAEFAERFDIQIPPELFVIADLSANAAFGATTEDYLIPSCLLNATISGLVSRSVYAGESSTDFHGCVYYDTFADQDLSQYFIEVMLGEIETVWQTTASKSFTPDHQPHQQETQLFLRTLAEQYGVKHPNYIKPGIGEATRVLLRRHPRLLLLQSEQAAATEHLRWLAASEGVPVAVMPQSPYQAIALIKEV